MPAIRFTQPHEWHEREVPAGTCLNVSLEEAKELRRLKVAEDDKPVPAPDMEPPLPPPPASALPLKGKLDTQKDDAK